MPYVIAQPCIDVMDKSCIEVCPVDCIHTEDGVDRICYIDPFECISCNLCLDACPVGAIFTEDDIPAAARPFVAVNGLWYRDPDAARAVVETLVQG